MSTATTVRKVRNADIHVVDRHWSTSENVWRMSASVNIDGAPLGRYVTVVVSARTRSTGRYTPDLTYAERKVAFADDPNVPMTWRRCDGYEIVGPPSKVQAAIVRECREMANAILAGEPVPM